MVVRRSASTEVHWYERERDMGDLTGRWLRAARAELPEAVPKRFGDSEPLRHRFDQEGDDGLRRAWEATESLLFLSARPGMDHAALAARARPARARLGDMGAHVLRIALPADDPRLRAFVLALATPTTVFVTVNEPGGSGIGGDRYLAGLGQWLGLPEEPPRWCWFGAAYTRALAQPVSRPRRWFGAARPSEQAPDVQLEPVAGGTLWTGGPWVPQSLRLVPAGLEPHDRWADHVPPEAGPRRPVWAGARRMRDW